MKIESLYITWNKLELYGNSRFDIYYNRYIHSSIIVKSVYVVIASICSVNHSVFNIYVLKRTLRSLNVCKCRSCSNCTFSACNNPLFKPNTNITNSIYIINISFLLFICDYVS